MTQGDLVLVEVEHSSMTDALLWLLAVVGAWNAINMAARVCCREPWWPYTWHVVVGAWAAIILAMA
jgi:hypothetical protein